MPKKPTVKAHRGFIHIPRRGRGPRRPPRFPGFPGFPRFPGIGGPRRPIRQPVRPPRGPLRPRGPRVDPSPDIRRDPKKLKDFMRRQREQQRRFDRQSTIRTNRELQARLRQGNLTPAQRKTLEEAMRRGELGGRGGSISPYQRQQLALARRRQREQQRLYDNFRRLRDEAFRRSTSAQRRAKGGAMVKPKDYVNPSSTIDRRKKK